jgi:transcriptional regulator NrdR family protein
MNLPCPQCGGTTRGIRGRAVGVDSHQQRRECKSCGKRITIVVSREQIIARPKPIPIEKLTHSA